MKQLYLAAEDQVLSGVEKVNPRTQRTETPGRSEGFKEGFVGKRVFIVKLCTRQLPMEPASLSLDVLPTDSLLLCPWVLALSSLLLSFHVFFL